ncbi:MAG: hypothetical protein SVM79_07515 [Chloroflexota bacterium]|nr:hypothetical protein [Chloroflexota bacterium]
MALIDNLSFGIIAVDGSSYRMRDVIIYPAGSVRRRPFIIDSSRPLEEGCGRF